jgi:signal transduction histidine kinase
MISFALGGQSAATAAAAVAVQPWWERMLLAIELGVEQGSADSGDGRGAQRSARDWIVDLALFAYAVFAAGATATNSRLQVGHTMLLVDAVLAVPACLSVWVRRRYPGSVGWLAVGLSAVSSSAVHACVVAVFSAAIHARPRQAVKIAAGAIAATALDCTIYTGSHGHAAFNGGFFAAWSATTVAALCLGSFVRVRRELVHRLQSEQQLQIHEAQLAERARIAREMHDVLAHRISLLSVHAGALEFNRDASPEEVARGLGVIRSSARAAQEELREVIGVLRSESVEDPVQPPQPTIEDLEQLIEESRGAGMTVTLAEPLPEPRLSTLAGRTVYRLVQEALTNARKHAPTQPVSVSVVGEPGATLEVEVVNRPAVDRADERSSGKRPDHVSSGTGLIGLAERVSLAGGTVEHQRLTGGGFRLIARIPWSVVTPGRTIDHDVVR